MHSRNNDVNIYVYIMRHIFCCIGVRNFLKFSGSKKKICQTYFEIGQTYFFRPPEPLEKMRTKTENTPGQTKT